MKLPVRYKIKSPKKSGGMSTVTLCRDSLLDRDVIIKTLSADVDEERLLDEIRALQKVRSGYVVQIYDVIENDGDIVAVVEEYCPGQDMSDLIGNVGIDDFYKLGYQLISGICEIHECGSIHRDIKPQNARVDENGNVKIIDFGLARDIDGGGKTLSEIGTAGFMAPELFIANKHGVIEFGREIDIFAFAASLFLLAEGSIPKDARKRPPILPCASFDFAFLKLPIDPDLRLLLNKCLETDPKKRPDATEIIASFRRVLLYNRHRALVNINGKASYLDAANPAVTATVNTLGSVRIEYDGNVFRLVTVTGNIYINNRKVNVGDLIPDSCVIAFGSPNLGSERVYITFDVSHPGIQF